MSVSCNHSPNSGAPTRVVSLSMMVPEGMESYNFPEPLLNDRFELARIFAEFVYELHAYGWLHKGSIGITNQRLNILRLSFKSFEHRVAEFLSFILFS
jgi:hypothetical protein